MKNKKEISDIARNNKMAMRAHTATAIIMILFCVLQALTDLVSWGYVLFTGLLGLLPVIAEHIFWRKNHESGMIKHFVAIGFALYFTVIIFTTTNNMVFLFVLPMILACSVYNDLRYSILINTGSLIECLLIGILGAKTGKFGYVGQDTAIVQFVGVALFGVFPAVPPTP